MSEDRTKEEQAILRQSYGIFFKGRGYGNLDKYVLENFHIKSVMEMVRETGISRSTLQATCRKLGLYKFEVGNVLKEGEIAKELEYPWEDYLITNQGRLINRKTGFVKQPFLKLGYLRYEINREGTYISISQHRLLALNFIPNPENKPEVNHIDGCRDNNSLNNLEWVTSKENSQHARHTLERKNLYGETNNFAKITEQQAMKLIKSIDNGQPNKEILKEFPYATKGILDGIRYLGNWSHLR